MNICDVCSVEWDPSSQNHRRGIDCAAGLRSLIDRGEGQVAKLKHIYQEMAEENESNRESVIEAFKKMRDDAQATIDRIGELERRFDNLAKRVHLIEKPKLANIRSMPKPEPE